MATKLDTRQSVNRSALSMVGSAANDSLDTILPKIDAELAKLFEDRNVLLTDGGIITFTGTQIQFTENLNIVLNQKISGAAPQVISLGSSNVNLNNGEMWYATVNRTAGTASTAIASTLPAVTSANQEIFLIVKRVDAGDGTQRLYWRSGMAMDAGQSVRLGSSGSGSGSGSGVGDDINTLLFRASFHDPFDEGPSSTNSAVDITAAHTDSTAYSAAKKMYVLNYDASKTIAAATTTTNINISAVAAFTVKTGDVVIANNQARRITAVATQASFTTEAFSVAPTLASQVTVSQAVHTKDIYNLPVDGSALSAAFSGATFNEIILDYEDTTTVGDSIFDVNVAPVIAYAASQDGTSFSDIAVRPTLETTTVSSYFLPAAGTGLYVRLFAYKQSGSGSVNVLRYKAFLQKFTSSSTVPAGGVLNSAYAFTNGVGTPYQCSLSVVGGKTTITLSSWQYAVGISSGAPYGSIDVYLNGQLLPRFINATLTPDGSYLETSPSIITLDRDYSSSNLSVEVLQRVQIVDASSTNSSNISVLQEINQNGFQGFVSQAALMAPTTSAGTPAAGTFYSSIQNRASMPDMSQDLKPRVGIERIIVEHVYPIQNEFGPANEPVWGASSDSFNQIRFVGNWTNNLSTEGPDALGNTASDFVEITFYGTGLNLLTIALASRDIRASVDGGSEGANIDFGTSTPLTSRNYSTNSIVSAVSGLALGIHTVKLRVVTPNFHFYGCEILTETSTLKVPPGVSYVNGLKLTSSALQSPAYASSFESGSLGSRGGRVIVYQKVDGSIAKAVNPTGSQLNLASADHSNEDPIRTYNFREFGSNRTDDFGSLGTSNSTRSFTLDDGSTTLLGSNVFVNLNVSGFEGYSYSGTGDYSSITFVGTGLNIVALTQNAGNPDIAVTVDGSSIGTINAGFFAAGNVPYSLKVVSGLPYGTHTVRFTRGAAAAVNIIMQKFVVFVPKKPSVPSGAIELADYNLMADFVANASAGLDTIATGVLRKTNTRERIYSGTFTLSLDVGTAVGGWNVISTTNGDVNEQIFFGTGFEVRGEANTGLSATNTVSLQALSTGGSLQTLNSTNFPGLTTSNYGGYTFTYASGNLAANAANSAGSGFRVSGLALGLYKIRITNGAANSHRWQGLDIISPVHSQKPNSIGEMQNTNTVGSCAISDNRKLTPVKEIAPAKAWGRAIGTSSGPSTTSGNFVPVPDMSITLKTNGGGVQMAFNGDFQINTNGQAGQFIFQVDGIQHGAVLSGQAQNASNNQIPFAMSDIIYLPAGTHKFDVYWATSATLTADGFRRIFTVREI